MYDPEIFESFMQHNLAVSNPRVRYIIINFSDTFTTILSSSNKYINYIVKEYHWVNSERTANAKILIPQNAILGLKTVLYGEKCVMPS